MAEAPRNDPSRIDVGYALPGVTEVPHDPSDGMDGVTQGALPGEAEAQMDLSSQEPASGLDVDSGIADEAPPDRHHDELKFKPGSVLSILATAMAARITVAVAK